MLMLVVEVFKLVLLMCGILSYQLKEDKKKVLLSFITAIIVTWYVIEVKTWIPYGNFFKGIIVMCMVLIAIEGKYKAGVCVVAYMMLSLFDMIIAIVVVKLLELDLTMDKIKVDGIENIICLSLLLFIYWGKKKKKIEHLERYLEWKEILMIGGVMAGFSMFLAGMQQVTISDIVSISLIIGTLFILILCLVFILQYNEKKRLEERNIMMEKLLKSQHNYYHMLSEKDKEMRNFSHDFRNHLFSIMILADQQDYGKIHEYIENLNGKIEKTEVQVQTGNDFMNAMVSDFFSNNSKVKLKWKGKLPSDISLPLVDVCTIFSNLFKNTLEAVSRIPEGGTVEVDIKFINGSLAMSIKNPTLCDIIVKNNKIKTVKKDKINHGLGIENVKKCVEKNHGSIEFIYKDHVFLVKLFIPV